MTHILATAKHAAYVFVVAFLGVISAAQISPTNLSTLHDAGVAALPAAIAAVVALARSLSPTVAAAVLKAAASAAPAAPAAAAAPIAPSQPVAVATAVQDPQA